MINYTITGKVDGFGSQYQAIMSGIAFCLYKNYNYIHTPFKILSNNESAENMNKFIGIPINNSKDTIHKSEKYAKNVHNSENPDMYYTKDALNIIKNYYYSVKKPNIDKIDIAIHIRRGDVTQEHKKRKKRFTSNFKYKKIIRFLQKKYPEYNITIFSEGSENDFYNIKSKNVSFMLNTNIEETFHYLVTAKILVTAKSSLSYCAALLNDNLIYYLDFWHKPLNKWIKIESLI